jgi:type IV pilus assembly protein PilA
MKKKGFTLIELLAVIIILAVLALILTPMIQELILNARKSAFERTIDGILSSAEYYQIENPSDETITFTCDGTSCEDSNGNKLTFKGEVPISGTITVSENGVVADNLCNNSFCGSGSRQGLAINIGGSGDINSISKAARKAGLDWIIITDHNVFDTEEGIYNDVFVIKGEEITPSNDNHYLALGINEFIEPSNDAKINVDNVRKRGGFGFAAHPNESRIRKKIIHYVYTSLIHNS